MGLTNTGKELIRDEISTLLVNGGIGIDDTVFTFSDTGLFGGGITVDACDSSTGWSVSGDSGAVTENTVSGEFVEGSGCLNLPSTFSTGVSEYYKTISSTNLENKKLVFWFYILSSSDINSSSGIDVQLGTGGFTDINVYNIDASTIVDGWNSILVDVSNPTSTSGSGADETDIDRFKLIVNLTVTQVTNDMRIDYIRYYEPDTLGITDSISSLTKSTGNYFIKTTHNIPTTSANGLSITESGDSDGSNLISRFTFTEVIKGQNTELQIDKFYYIEGN